MNWMAPPMTRRRWRLYMRDERRRERAEWGRAMASFEVPQPGTRSPPLPRRGTSCTSCRSRTGRDRCGRPCRPAAPRSAACSLGGPAGRGASGLGAGAPGAAAAVAGPLSIWKRGRARGRALAPPFLHLLLRDRLEPEERLQGGVLDALLHPGKSS